MRIRLDKKKKGVLLEATRSNLFLNLACLVNEGAISLEELSDFSEELQELVRNTSM